YAYPEPDSAFHYLPLFFAAQGVVFLVTPLKQFLNAKHMFTPYGVVAVVSNVCKIILAILLIKADRLSINTAGTVLLICAALELVSLFIYIKTRTNFKM